MESILQPIFGIIYFVAWSIGFYFQIALMIKTRSGDGFSVDNQLLALLGTIFFFCFNTHLMIINPDFYQIVNFIYMLQCLILSLVIFTLTFYFPRKINKFQLSLGLIIAIFILMKILFYIYGVRTNVCTMDDFWLFMGLANCWICAIKYMYQIVLNYDKKSTKGFAIEGILGDLVGSFAVLINGLIEYNIKEQPDLNMPLLLMAVISIFFDWVLVHQHYYIYNENKLCPRKSVVENTADITSSFM